MSNPNPKRQKAARGKLDDLFAKADQVTVIHYSCESFYNRPEGKSPRITSIALRKLESAQTKSFSIHQTAEIHGSCLDMIKKRYDCLEREMLTSFFTYLSKFQNEHFLHWNMRDANYGFQAIEHRFRVLQGKCEELHVVRDSQKADLSRLLQDIYGSGLIDHPRLEKLLDKNCIARKDFLSGECEAHAFECQDFAALHLSTLRKVDVIASVAVLAHDRKLKTNTSWWGMRGGHVLSVMNWLGNHPIVTLVFALVGISITIAPLVFSCR